MEEQLQGLNRKFRARIGQGTVALTQANGGLVSGKFPKQVGNAHRADIRELAASIAHDFNNILSVVEAYAALIVRNPAKPKDVLEHAEVIKETVDKARCWHGSWSRLAERRKLSWSLPISTICFTGWSNYLRRCFRRPSSSPKISIRACR